MTTSRLRWLRVGVLAGAALSVVLTACSSAQPGGGSSSPGTTSATSSAPVGSGAPTTGTSSSRSGRPTDSPSPKPTRTGPPPEKVHVTGFPDGSTVGVGMPIIATFNKKITSAKAFAAGTTVTVNGKVVHGGWYFEYSDPASGHVMEAHYRLRHYWPADSRVHVAFDLKGQSAGKSKGRDLVFDGKLTSLDFRTGDRHIAVVDNATHRMTVTSNGHKEGVYPVSLGADDTPTRSGTKVIMEQVPTVCMHDTNGTYYECGIKWDSRLTYDGEYLHSAPWNTPEAGGDIGSGNSSNGCTNLIPDDAEKLYHFLRVGDVVKYPNANGPKMQLGDGYGDWNVDWTTWQTGGALTV